MKIVIPMSGEGRRFREAGYKEIKPLIKVDNKPMVEHVIDMFPGEKEFIFFCNNEHLKATELGRVLKRKAPHGKIVGIAPHKLGPVYAVMQAASEIPDNEPVIVNYCDFYAEWDYAAFREMALKGRWDCGVTGYTGFHPHLLWKNPYAGMRVGNGMKLLEIREKHSFTENPMDSYHSTGTYYFRSGAILKECFSALMDKKMSVNGEYYVSSASQLLIKAGKKAFAYGVDYFLQWGTPQDLEEYMHWSRSLRRRPKSAKKKLPGKTTMLVPMAGKGQRFIDAGYSTPKPLIGVDGKPMFVNAVQCLPKADEYVFVCSAEHIQKHGIHESVKEFFPRARIVVAERPTQGQASSCLLARDFVDADSALLIAACDNTVDFSAAKLSKAAAGKKARALIWTFRGNPAVKRKPTAYGWVKTRGEKAERVFCKEPVSTQPMKDHAVSGIFYYKRAGDFFQAAQEMVGKGRNVNGEYYADTVPNELIEQGDEVRVFEVDNYTVFGTPDDLRTYEYWKSYFTKQKSKGIGGPLSSKNLAGAENK